jgi:hypothetical protein
MRMIMETRATRRVLRAIIRRDYAGSQADFSAHCGLDSADTSRVVAGIRSATLGLVRRAALTLREESAIELIEAFLSDVAGGVTDAFTVNIAVKANGSVVRSGTAGARKKGESDENLHHRRR